MQSDIPSYSHGEREKEMMRERQTLRGALLGVIVEEGLHCLTHNQSTYDRQRQEKQE